MNLIIIIIVIHKISIIIHHHHHHHSKVISSKGSTSFIHRVFALFAIIQPASVSVSFSFFLSLSLSLSLSIHITNPLNPAALFRACHPTRRSIKNFPHVARRSLGGLTNFPLSCFVRRRRLEPPKYTIKCPRRHWRILDMRRLVQKVHTQSKGKPAWDGLSFGLSVARGGIRVPFNRSDVIYFFILFFSAVV